MSSEGSENPPLRRAGRRQAAVAGGFAVAASVAMQSVASNRPYIVVSIFLSPGDKARARGPERISRGIFLPGRRKKKVLNTVRGICEISQFNSTERADRMKWRTGEGGSKGRGVGR